MNKSQEGFTVVEVLLLTLVLAVIGIGGYYVWNQNMEDKPVTTVGKTTTTTPLATPRPETPASTTIAVDNKYFTIKLPSGWSEDKTSLYNVSKDASYIYTDGKGRKAVVVVNIGNVGGAGDASGTYSVTGNNFKFGKLTFCSPGYGCDYGDGKLRVQYSSAEKVSGNNYFFDISDTSAETQATADVITAILETIQVN